MNLKNLFKTETNNIQTDVMDVIEKGYPKIVKEIHEEFMTAGDKLLNKANSILESLKIKDKEKIEALKAFGFVQTKQVQDTKEVEKKINEQKRISDAVSHFRVEYPNYKYITTEIAEKICKKYSLVLGSVSLYKAFVPQKNLDDIARFMLAYPKDNYVYVEVKYSLSPYQLDRVRIITEKEYLKKTQSSDADNKTPAPSTKLNTIGALANPQSMMQNINQHQLRIQPVYSKEQATLAICAPLKDMDTANMKLEGVRLVKDIPIPDPVVLLPKNHSNGIEGYLILTAWGDEASDPMVVNEQMN